MSEAKNEGKGPGWSYKGRSAEGRAKSFSFREKSTTKIIDKKD